MIGAMNASTHKARANKLITAALPRVGLCALVPFEYLPLDRHARMWSMRSLGFFLSLILSGEMAQLSGLNTRVAICLTNLSKRPVSISRSNVVLSKALASAICSAVGLPKIGTLYLRYCVSQ